MKLEAEGKSRHFHASPPRHRPYLADEKNLITFKNLVLSLLRNICYLQSVAGPSPRLMKPRRSRGRPTAVLLPKHRTKGHQTRIITKRYKAWRSYSHRLDWGGLWAVKHPHAATATGRFNYTENIRLLKNYNRVCGISRGHKAFGGQRSYNSPHLVANTPTYWMKASVKCVKNRGTATRHTFTAVERISQMISGY